MSDTGTSISRTIDLMVDHILRTPEQKAEALTKITVMLRIPIEMVEAQQAKGLQAEHDIIEINKQIEDLNVILKKTLKKQNAGKRSQLQVDNVKRQLDNAHQRLVGKQQFITDVETIHNRVTNQARQIVESLS